MNNFSFSVVYTDDFNKKHLTFVKTLCEFLFIKDRYEDATIVELT